MRRYLSALWWARSAVPAAGGLAWWIPSALVVLAGCAPGGPLSGSGGAPLEIRIEAAANANHSRATTLDIVFVYDTALAAALGGLSAADWFRHKQEYLAAPGAKLDVTSWSVMPGQKGLARAFPGRHREAVAVLVFADYATAGAHRAQILGNPSVAILLGERGFVVAPR